MNIFNKTFQDGQVLTAQDLNSLKQIVNGIIDDNDEGINKINERLTDIEDSSSGGGGGESVSYVTTPISCFKWSISVPSKPENSLSPDGWSLIAPDKPSGEGNYDLYMCTGTKKTPASGSPSLVGQWSDPLKLNGDPGSDSKEREWIFIYNTANVSNYNGNSGQVNPSGAAEGTSTNKNQDGWVPQYWYNKALSVQNEKEPIDKTTVYASYRDYDKTNSTWKAFNTPIVWSHWGEQGLDGDGVQYIYKLYPTKLGGNELISFAPKKTTKNSNGEWLPVTTSSTDFFTGKSWTDNPEDVTKEFPFCYCSTIKELNGEWGDYGELSLWNEYVEGAYYLIANPSQLIYNPNTEEFIDKNKFTVNGFVRGEELEDGDYSYTYKLVGINSSGEETNISTGLRREVTADASYVSYKATITVNNVVVATLTIPIIKYGLDSSEEASTGRMFYMAGEWNPSVTYGSDPNLCPVVYHEDTGKYWYLESDTEVSGTNYIPGTSEVWKEAENYGLVITEAIFAKFAKLGSFVVSRDFFFSQYGYVVKNGSVVQTVNSEQTSLYNGVPAYTLFDATDPMVENNSSTAKFRPMKCFNAMTGEEWMAGGNIHINSTGDIEMQNAIIKGSLAYNKVRVVQGTSIYENFFIQEYKNGQCVGFKLPANILVITGRPPQSVSYFTVVLPSAKFMPGASIKIVNGCYNNELQYEPATIKLNVIHADTEDVAEDTELNYMNNLATVIPFTNNNNTSIYGYFTEITYNKYQSIQIVSMPNVFQRPDLYVWTIVEANKNVVIEKE